MLARSLLRRLALLALLACASSQLAADVSGTVQILYCMS